MRGQVMALFHSTSPASEPLGRAVGAPFLSASKANDQNHRKNGLISLGLLALSPGPARGDEARDGRRVSP